jgi:hypothetical protein
MPCCCARCGAAFDLRTQQQIRMLQRFADLGIQLAEAVADFPLRTRHIDVDVSQNYELLSRGARRSLALEAKLTEDARRRHQREAHGAPPPGAREQGGSVLRETAENLLSDSRERLLDPFVENHTPAVAAGSVCRDFNLDEDLTVFPEPRPASDGPRVQADAAEADAEAEVGLREAPRWRDEWRDGWLDPGPTVPRPAETGHAPDRPPPVAKGRTPP